MSRSSVFARVKRALRLAADCDRVGVSAGEGIARAAETRSRSLRRRDFLHGAGAAGALAVAGCAMDTEVGRSRSHLHLPPVDVGIVGAGLAGLACADELAGYGIAATVHEASDRAGGRVFSMGGRFGGPVDFGGQVIERGGELIDTTHQTLRAYARQLGLTLETYTKRPGETHYHFHGRSYSEEEVVDEIRALVPRMREDLRRSSRGPTADAFTEGDRELDHTTLQEWLETRGAGPLARSVLSVAYTIEYGLEIDRQSSLNLLLFMHADRRSRFEPFGVFSDERFHVVEGNQAIADGLAARIPRPVQHGRRLVAARRLSDGRVELTMQEGAATRTYRHDAVVFAIPFSILRAVDLDDSLGLPAWKRLAIDELAYGTNAKLMIGFDGAPWETYGGNGTAYSDLPHHQSSWETNYSRATAREAVLTDYSGGARGAALDPDAPRTEAERTLADLERLWPGAAAAARRDAGGAPSRVHLEHWASNPLSRGSYTCNQPGYFTTIADNEGKPVDNLFFAGEHANSFYDWQGFMEGAALSGLDSAAQIVDRLRGRTG